MNRLPAGEQAKMKATIYVDIVFDNHHFSALGRAQESHVFRYRGVQNFRRILKYCNFKT